MKQLKVVELFSGIGSQAKALKNIGLDHKIVGISDWDIYALISYAVVHYNKEFTVVMNKYDRESLIFHVMVKNNFLNLLQ